MGEALTTVCVKLGSSTLLDESGKLDIAFVRSLCDQVAELKGRGMRVVVVSSGAVACGFGRLGFAERPHDLASLQACSSAGQALLTETYADALAAHGIPCGQVLLTRRDVLSRESYLNARATLDRLLELGAVPVVNENDATSNAEINFGDNDMLGAIVSSLIDADLYVIMSDIDGLYEHDPAKDPDAELIGHVSSVGGDIFEMAGGSGSGVGTGGMVTKLRAARAMVAAGIPMVICQGREPNVLARIVDGEDVGTRFESDDEAHSNPRKLWIGLAGVPKGELRIDDGALRALVEEGGSLLPVGVRGCEGSFEAGDIVDVVDGSSSLVGRGIVRYSSDEMEQVKGLRLDVIARFLPHREGQPCVHRDELLLF